MKVIQLIDSGCTRYSIAPGCRILGYQWDDLSEKLKVIKPAKELQNACTMIVTHEGQTIDHILIGNEPIDIRNTISQFTQVDINFVFTNATGYTKYSATEPFEFLETQQLQEFTPVPPQQVSQIEQIIANGLVRVKWSETTENTLEFLNLAGQIISTITFPETYTKEEADLKFQEKLIAGENITIDENNVISANITQAQADLAETDTTSPSFVKNKQLKQDALVSGVNIKTINNQDIIGSGNINIQGVTNYNNLTNQPSINGVTLIGNKTTEDLHISGGKIDVIALNNVDQTITNKRVNLTVDKNTVGLGNVNNTSDLNKPISTATQNALDVIDGNIETLSDGLQEAEQDIQEINTELDNVSEDLGDLENEVADILDELPTIRSGASAGATALQPDDVVDNVSTTQTKKPLSANMGKELQDQINNLKQRGRYLSIWNCTTGLAMTTPVSPLPYNYKAGDYFIVGVVGTTNYIPTGTQYTGVASTTTSSVSINLNDTFYYDGTTWSLLSSGGQVSSSFSSLGGSPYDNTNLANALNGKQPLIDSTHKLSSALIDSIVNSIGDTASTSALTTESAIYNYVASGNGGKPRALSNVDLNTISATGFYSCNVCTNRPTENNGVMLVLKNALTSDNVVQVYWTFTADVMWVRHKDLGNWKEWRSVLKGGDIDLTNYVTNTDYAGGTSGGVIKVNAINGNTVDSNGRLIGTTRTYTQYDEAAAQLQISKGTLENVIAGKGLEPVLYDIGQEQDTYHGYVIPKILKTDAQAIYALAKSKTPVKIKWTVLGSETDLNVLSADEIGGVYSFDICLHNKYHIAYSYDANTGTYADFDVSGYEELVMTEAEYNSATKYNQIFYNIIEE